MDSLFEMTLTAIDTKLRKMDSMDRTLEQVLRRMDAIDTRLSDQSKRTDQVRLAALFLHLLFAFRGRLLPSIRPLWVVRSAASMHYIKDRYWIRSFGYRMVIQCNHCWSVSWLSSWWIVSECFFFYDQLKLTSDKNRFRLFATSPQPVLLGFTGFFFICSSKKRENTTNNSEKSDKCSSVFFDDQLYLRTIILKKKLR